MQLPEDIENVIMSYIHIPEYIKDIPSWVDAFNFYYTDVIFDESLYENTFFHVMAFGL
jgi:hypothetical protein